MAFNKSRAIETAAKFLSQGKLAQAISEYQEVLRHDPKDQLTLMTVGDLFVRQGDVQHAIEHFERLSQIYRNEGFNSKAIAVYKKIVKLSPNEIQPLERLADLYVQQGVLGEARSVFLQLAEIHLRANSAGRAVEVLRRLLEIEPENARVQMHLAELYHGMGQKKEAAQTLLNYGRRLFDDGELREALELAEHALKIDPGNMAGTSLKAQVLAATGQVEAAIALLESLADAEEGAETTAVLIDLLLRTRKTLRAAELARKSFARSQTNCMLAHKAAMALVESGNAEAALPLVDEIREAMIESAEHDPLSQALAAIAARLPGRLEPLEWLVDLYRRWGDPARLKDAVSQLANASAAIGQLDRAESLFAELLERDPGNEALLARLNEVRAKREGQPQLSAPATAPQPALRSEMPVVDETQRYLNQTLTDVDLLSSYGQPEKAIRLLETALQRFPNHAPTLERLLDLYLGVANHRRAAELAWQLEQNYLQQGDQRGAERFAELRRRFQRATGLTSEELAAQGPATSEQVSASRVEPAAPVGEKEIAAARKPQPRPIPTLLESPTSRPPAAPVAQAGAPRMAPGHEFDLSEEWAALLAEPAVPEHEGNVSEEWAVLSQEIAGLQQAPPQKAAGPDQAAAEATPPSEFADRALESLSSASAAEKDAPAPMLTDQFLSELAAEIEGLQPPQAAVKLSPPGFSESAQAAATEKTGAESLEQLREIFQEFRSGMGERGEEEEDLETHYNLGIAYREMGLLDEAIGEFQKVAKAVQSGRPFRYAMQCSTLLGLAFMAKAEPKIAAVWYQRALETPELDPESTLALRYDLGVAQELSGDINGALESFRQVYAMNIDYRDVAERISALLKR